MVCAKCGESVHKRPQQTALMVDCNSCGAVNYIIGIKTFYIEGDDNGEGTDQKVDCNEEQGTR